MRGREDACVAEIYSKKRWGAGIQRVAEGYLSWHALWSWKLTIPMLLWKWLELCCYLAEDSLESN